MVDHSGESASTRQFTTSLSNVRMGCGIWSRSSELLPDVCAFGYVWREAGPTRTIQQTARNFAEHFSILSPGEKCQSKKALPVVVDCYRFVAARLFSVVFNNTVGQVGEMFCLEESHRRTFKAASSRISHLPPLSQISAALKKIEASSMKATDAEPGSDRKC